MVQNVVFGGGRAKMNFNGNDPGYYPGYHLYSRTYPGLITSLRAYRLLVKRGVSPLAKCCKIGDEGRRLTMRDRQCATDSARTMLVIVGHWWLSVACAKNRTAAKIVSLTLLVISARV